MKSTLKRALPWAFSVFLWTNSYGQDGPLFSEDFEGLTLGPNVDESVAGDTVWTNAPPEGWEVDNSNLFGADEDGVGVTEWKGWAFANKEWWIEAAEDQRRSEWLSGTNTVAIVDPDEWDDLGDPGAQEPGGFETYMSTPAIDVSGIGPNTAVLSFDSSWRPEFDENYRQSANLHVSFDGGAPIELFEWLSDESSPNFKGEALDEKVIIPLNNPEGASEMVLTFGMFDAGNDWWWAIDNIQVTTGAVISKLTARRSIVTFELTDTGSSNIDPETVVLQVGGETIDAEITTVDGVVRIVYQPVPPLIPAQTYPYAIDASDESGEPIQFEGEFTVPVPLFPENVLPGSSGTEGEFGVRYIWGGGTINTAQQAIDAILAVESGEWAGAFFDTTHTHINHGSGIGLFPGDELYPDEVVGDLDVPWSGEDFVQFAKGTIRITEPGEYTFGVQSDDGFAFRIFGAEFTNVSGQGVMDVGSTNTMAHPGTTGNSSTRGTVMLSAGDYDVEFFWFERSGGDFGELYVARGAFAADADTETWQLIGAAPDGETPFVTLVGSPLAKPSVIDFSLSAGDAMIDFTTPEPEGTHELQSSSDLQTWNTDPQATLTDVGEGIFRFATPLTMQSRNYYRVGLLPPPPVYSTDFEAGADDWSVVTDVGDTDWELGTPASDPVNTAASGTMAWGTNLTEDYTPNTVTALRSPVIDITGIARPKLSFNYFVDTVPTVEGGQLRILDASGALLYTREEIFSGSTEAWTPFILTLPPAVRDQSIILEFRLLSDGDANVGAGWFIDDVVVDR